MQDMLKNNKIIKFITSMKFAMALLLVIVLACTAGSLVTQGQSLSWYTARYSERTAGLIMALHLDDAFHSWWFILISVFLCLDLVFCNLIRLPSLIERTKKEGTFTDTTVDRMLAGGEVAEGLADPAPLFRKLRMPQPKEYTDSSGRGVLFSVRNRAGLWGAWVCHLGILLIIAGFGLGQMTKEQYTVYGIPGQTREIGSTGYMLTINDFTTVLREDDTVEQYTSDITVAEPAEKGGRAERDTVSVNDPAGLFGMSFFQNSTGWAARIKVLKDGEPLQDEVICGGEYIRILDKQDLVVYLNSVYPDYEFVPGQGPSTRSGRVVDPGYLYTVYYRDEILGMNVLMQDEELTIDEYTVTFSEPQQYTLLSVKKDRFTWLAFAGGMVIMLGLILAFYLRPEKVAAFRSADGDTDPADGSGRWTAAGISAKGGSIYRDSFRRAAQQVKDGK